MSKNKASISSNNIHLLCFSLSWWISYIKSLTIHHKVDPRNLHGTGVDSARVLASVLVPDMSDVQIPVIYLRVFDWYSGIVNEPPLIFTYQYFLGVHPHHLSVGRNQDGISQMLYKNISFFFNFKSDRYFFFRVCLNNASISIHWIIIPLKIIIWAFLIGCYGNF